MTTGIFWAGAMAALARFFRLRRKQKYPERERIEVLLPEWLKFGCYWLFMIVWFKVIDVLFNLM